MRTREQLTSEALERIDPGYVFFPHWSWKIPAEIHDRFDCVIFHMTDVPFGRGGSPLQNLIVRGYRDTMLSAIKCVEALDAGPVYLKRPLSLDGNAEAILRRASGLMEEMIVEILERSPTPVPQEGNVVEFRRRKRADGDLAPLAEPEKVYDYIRMLDADGYPPAFLRSGRLLLEFREARLDGDAVEAKVTVRRAAE
jgi:methionyl-tRNA formyltransferase